MTTPPKNRRGSPEAIARRVAARKLNDLLTQGETPGEGEDGRTARRRKRLLALLAEKTQRPDQLKPIELLQCLHDLLELGESVASLKKVVKVHPRPPLRAETADAIVAELHRAYAFRAEVYAFLGLPSPRTDADVPSPPSRR